MVPQSEDAGTGFLHALRLDGEGGASALATSEMSAWRTDPGVLWVHLDYSDERAQVWLREESGLEELQVDALLAEDTRPRVAPHGTGLSISLRGVNRHTGEDPEDMIAVRLWVDGKRVITTRKRLLYSVRDVLESFDRNQGPCTTGEVVVELCERLTFRAGGVIEEEEDRMGDLEELVLDAESHELRSQLSQIRRRAIGLRKYLAPQKEALMRLAGEKVTWMSDRDRSHMREVSDHLMRHLEELEAVRDRAVVTQEELVNRLSDQMNKRMYMLSIVAAIFLPLGFFTGLLGINVGGIPGSENREAFWVFVLILCVVVAVQVAVFRKLKWL